MRRDEDIEDVRFWCEKVLEHLPTVAPSEALWFGRLGEYMDEVAHAMARVRKKHGHLIKENL